MLKRIFFLLVLLGISMSGHALRLTPARGGETAGPAVFTLDSFLTAYMERCPELLVARNSLLQAKNDYHNAFVTSFLPSFSVGASANKTYIRQSSTSSWGDYHNVDASAYADGNWNLFNSGKDYLSYQSARINYEMEQLSFTEQVQNEALKAVRVYYALVLRTKLLQIAKDDLKTVEKQYKRDQKFYDNGLAKRSDVLTSETNFRSAQLSLLSAQNNYDNALHQFNLSLDRSLEAPVELTEEKEPAFMALSSLEEDIENALENRFDSRMRRLSLQQADYAVALARRRTLPSVYVDTFASTSRGITSHERWGYNYGIRAGVSFDLGFLYFDKYLTRQNVALTQDNAYLNYDAYVRTLKENVAKDRNNLQLTQKSLEISHLRLKAAVQKYEATQQKYDNGLMSATDLTLARQEMVTAQVNYATLLSDLTQAQLEYKHALGQTIYTLPEDF